MLAMELDLGLLPSGMRMSCRPPSPDSDGQSVVFGEPVKTGPPGLLLPQMVKAQVGDPPGLWLPQVVPKADGPPGLLVHEETEVYLVKQKIFHPDQGSLARENAALAEANARLAVANALLKMEVQLSATQMTKPESTFPDVHLDDEEYGLQNGEVSRYPLAHGPPGVWLPGVCSRQEVKPRAELISATYGWAHFDKLPHQWNPLWRRPRADTFSSDATTATPRPRRAKSMSIDTFCSDTTPATGPFSATDSSFCEFDWEQSPRIAVPSPLGDVRPTVIPRRGCAECGPPGIFFADVEEHLQTMESPSGTACIDASAVLPSAPGVSIKQTLAATTPAPAEVGPKAAPEASREPRPPRSRVSPESLVFEVPPPRQPRELRPCEQSKPQLSSKPSKRVRRAARQAGRAVPNDSAMGGQSFGKTDSAIAERPVASGTCTDSVADADRFESITGAPRHRAFGKRDPRNGKCKAEMHDVSVENKRVASACAAKIARQMGCTPRLADGFRHCWLLRLVGLLSTILCVAASIYFLCTYAREFPHAGTHRRLSPVLGFSEAWSAVTPKQGSLSTRQRSVASVIQGLSVEVARASVITESDSAVAADPRIARRPKLSAGK